MIISNNRLVYDRETGKPKGFGFCEYKDQDTAQSAMRNLNGTEIHGRQLRVDSATSQKAAADDTKSMIPFVLLFSSDFLLCIIAGEKYLHIRFTRKLYLYFY